MLVHEKPSFRRGPHNAITDVAGVRVDHVTLIEGDGPLRPGRGPVRTGVTVVVPPGDLSLFHEPRYFRRIAPTWV